MRINDVSWLSGSSFAQARGVLAPYATRLSTHELGRVGSAFDALSKSYDGTVWLEDDDGTLFHAYFSDGSMDFLCELDPDGITDDFLFVADVVLRLFSDKEPSLFGGAWWSAEDFLEEDGRRLVEVAEPAIGPAPGGDGMVFWW